MKQLWTEDHFSGFEGKYYSYPAFYESYLAIPKPYPPMLLPVDSQESFVPMGEQGYRIGSTDAGTASPEATEEVNLFGTPEEVCDKIEMLRDDFSTDEIMFEVNWTSSVSREVVMTTMRCLTDKVIPKFK